jgi:hypothetical protein
LTFGFRPQCPYNYTATLKKEVLARWDEGRIIGAPKGARKRAAAVREAEFMEAGSMVGPDGIMGAGAADADNSAMSQWRAWLAPAARPGQESTTINPEAAETV